MDELIAKLTNLSYDFFGILLPGLIFNIFVFLLWFALGALVPFWTNGGIPEFTAQTLPKLADTLSLEGRIFTAIPLVFLWYFMGHLLNWLGRSGISIDGRVPDRTRVFNSLIFRIPKPKSSFDSKLEPLYKVIQEKFSPVGVEVTWAALFPVLKTYLAQNLSRSLITTYQNKYTLHRSVTTASTLLFWLSTLSIVAGLLMSQYYGVCPNWLFLTVLAVGSLALVWGFSGSYAYNWMLFGNSIVTETYSLLNSPKNERPSK